MKILVIRFSSIGDIVLTTPVVRAIKQQIPDAEVHFLTKKQYVSIMESNPYVDKILFLADSWSLLLHSLRSEKYDYVIDLHRNLRTRRVKRGLRNVPAFSFNKLNFRKWIYTTFKINLLPKKLHVVDRYMATLKKLNITNDGKGLDYFIPKEELIRDNDIPLAHRYGFIGIAIGAGVGTKKMPIQLLAKLCSKIDYPIILLGEADDREGGDIIANIDKDRIYNACGKFTLNETADLISRSKAIVAHDTSLMHIAAAFHKPIVSIWGNTVPAFGMYPYFPSGTAIPNKQFGVSAMCRPCSKIGYKKCPYFHFHCMKKQDIDTIAKAAISFANKENIHENFIEIFTALTAYHHIEPQQAVS